MPPGAETGVVLFDVHVLDVPPRTPSGEDFGDAFAAAFGVDRRVADALILGVPMRVKRALPRGAADEMVATLDALGAIAEARPAEVAAARSVLVSVPSAAPRVLRPAPAAVPLAEDDAVPPPSLEEPPSLQVLPPPKRVAPLQEPPEPPKPAPPPVEPPRTVDGPRDDFDEPESGEALSLDLGETAPPPKDTRPSGRVPAAEATATATTTAQPGGAATDAPPEPPPGAMPRPAFVVATPPPARSFEIPFVAKVVVALAIVGGITLWAVGWMRSYGEMRTLSGMPRGETWCAKEDCLATLKIPKDKRGTKLTLVATWRDECPEAYLTFLEKLADTHPKKLGVVAVAAVHRQSSDPRSWGSPPEAEPTLWPSPQCQPRFFALPPGDGTLHDDLPRPATYLFDDDGRLVAAWRGGLSEGDQERLTAWLKKTL